MPTDERLETLVRTVTGNVREILRGDPSVLARLILMEMDRIDTLLSERTERTGDRERLSEDGIFRRGYHVGYADGRAENPEDADWHLAIEGPAPEPERGEDATEWALRKMGEPERGEGAPLDWRIEGLGIGGDDAYLTNGSARLSLFAGEVADPDLIALNAQLQRGAASPEPAGREPLWMEGFRKLEQVAAHICWDCREVTFTNDLWAKDGCPKCGAHGYAFPMVFRETPPAPTGDLRTWLTEAIGDGGTTLDAYDGGYVRGLRDVLDRLDAEPAGDDEPPSGSPWCMDCQRYVRGDHDAEYMGHAVRRKDATGDTGEYWRPIATAPKGGTRVLLRILWRGHPEADVQTHIGYWTDHNGGGWVGYFNGVPTHWMPLPAAPQDATGEEVGNGD